MQAADLADEFADEIAAEFGTNAEEKRGEPWKKRDDVMQPEVPVFVTGDDSDDITEDDDNDSEEETTALALGRWFDKSELVERCSDKCTFYLRSLKREKQTLTGTETDRQTER